MKWKNMMMRMKKMTKKEKIKFANKYTVQWEMFYGMTNVNSKKGKKGQELFISNYPQE